MERYFKNCKVKYTICTRNSDGTFTFQSFEQDGCILKFTEGKPTYTFCFQYGIQFFERKKRTKSFKFKGTEITEKEYRQQRGLMMYEAYKNEQQLKK